MGAVDKGFGLHWLLPCKWVRLSPRKKGTGYNTKHSYSNAGALGNAEYPLFALPPSPLRTGVVAPDRVLSIGKKY